jgi:hypothetical protein
MPSASASSAQAPAADTSQPPSGPPRHLDAPHQPHVAHGDLGDQPTEPHPAGRAGPGLAEILVDHQHPRGRPAQRDRPLYQPVLQPGRLAMVDHLLAGGLAHIHHHQPRKMPVTDLAAQHSHASTAVIAVPLHRQVPDADARRTHARHPGRHYHAAGQHHQPPNRRLAVGLRQPGPALYGRPLWGLGLPPSSMTTRPPRHAPGSQPLDHLDQPQQPSRPSIGVCPT